MYSSSKMEGHQVSANSKSASISYSSVSASVFLGTSTSCSCSSGYSSSSPFSCLFLFLRGCESLSKSSRMTLANSSVSMPGRKIDPTLWKTLMYSSLLQSFAGPVNANYLDIKSRMAACTSGLSFNSSLPSMFSVVYIEGSPSS